MDHCQNMPVNYKQQFIQASKKAVDELLKVIKADINFCAIEKDTKGKTAIKTKKKAIIKSKNIIAGVLEYDHNQQNWAREKIEQIIQSGDSAIQSLLSGLEDIIVIQDDGIADDAGDISNAIDAKSIAFDDAVKIMDVITELKRISSEDEIIISANDFKGGYAEQYAGKLTRATNKAGYDPQKDHVVIDPEGTVSDTIEISGIRIALPEKPDKEKIQNAEKTKHEQRWVRQAPPKGITPKTAKTHEHFIQQEYEKKQRGMWFYNNGKPEYITGPHWYLLTHCRTAADGGYYYFTKAQQKLFIFMEACWCDQRSMGMILEKIRRFGATDCVLAFQLCKATSYRDKICGMTSKTDSDASKNFLRETWMFSNLPFYLKPMCLNEKSKSMLEFSQPANRLTKNNQNNDTTDVSLNTRIDYLPTKEDSYDGEALMVYIGDEFSKWKKQNGNTITHFEMVRKCLTKGKRITGKALILSTIENVTGKDAQEENAQAGDRYKWLYENSDPENRDRNGNTVTGLYKLFISCYEHYEGLIDQYGYPITEDPPKPTLTADGEITETGIKTYISRALEIIKGNPRAMREYKRKTPIKEQDGFAIEEGVCTFNQANIELQMLYNDNLHPVPYRTGNFKWIDEKDESKGVLWKDTPAGRFKITWMPDEDLRNNVKYVDGILRPMNTEIGNFGIDPYRVNQTVDGKGSKGAIHGFARHNAKGAPNHTFFLEYINRPKSKDIFHNDAICALVFYGMPALIENNVNNLIEEMYRRGYQKFSMRRPDKPKNKLSDDELKFGGIPSSSENVQQMMSSELEKFIEYHVGDRREMYFNATLQDWLVFDPHNRTKRDASISSSMALIGATSKTKRNTITQTVQRQPLLHSYDNTGITSKIINYEN